MMSGRLLSPSRNAYSSTVHTPPVSLGNRVGIERIHLVQFAIAERWLWRVLGAGSTPISVYFDEKSGESLVHRLEDLYKPYHPIALGARL